MNNLDNSISSLNDELMESELQKLISECEETTNQICMVCRNAILNENTIDCTVCGQWLHTACERISENSINNHTEYICSSCRILDSTIPYDESLHELHSEQIQQKDETHPKQLYESESQMHTDIITTCQAENTKKSNTYPPFTSEQNFHIPPIEVKAKQKRTKKKDNLEQNNLELQLAECKVKLSNLQTVNQEYSQTINLLSSKLGIPTPLENNHQDSSNLQIQQLEMKFEEQINNLKINFEHQLNIMSLQIKLNTEVNELKYKLYHMENECNKYKTSASVDDEYPILDYKAIRGYGGTAIFWQKDLNNAVNIMPDGNYRIQVLTRNSSPNPVCLIYIYMPSAQNSGDNEYKDTLDQISEIMDKYKEIYQIILCGDMNASLHRDNRKRDKIFEEFKNINNFHIPDSYPIKPTFFHHNGIWNSKINQASTEAKSAHTIWKDKTIKNQDAVLEKQNLKNKKRRLRQLQRQAHASKKEKCITEIMQASEKDSKTFHKLIKQQRSYHPSNTDILYIGNTKYKGENVLEAWSIHFGKLGTLNYDKKYFDLERFRLAKLQNDIILKNQHSKKEIKQTTTEEVKTAIKNLSTGKTSDENGICSEHYKEAVDEVSVEIASIINNIFTNLDVPKSFKNGILTPVLKKKKNKTIPRNYRGIVVTSIFSKIFESIVKGRLEYELLPSQNPLQRGFTEGASSLFAAFIITETILLYS
ncbi:unnamed protein product [Mytilus coruscus]|uniref:Zinc finger PHD-type domain-containing protein n=1 Tax=Mytilus coruscus TaxID=42192 RepID=A0A6J8D6Y9_MYTCO|nr:unnamed protein product [Mytilus coruscus]